jgi:nucleotide-binding universal stress UspA family protein
MQIKKVVFPTDFSRTSKAALSFAESLVRDQGGKLYIVHVEEPPAAYGGGDLFYGIPSATLEDVKRLLLSFVPSDPNVAFEHHLVHGAPAEAITEFAESVDADLIVIGTHGRTGLNRMLMGSVAEAVVRHANRPVLTFKPKAAPEKTGDAAAAAAPA